MKKMVRMVLIHYLDKLAPVALIFMCGVFTRLSSPILNISIFAFTFVIYILLRYDLRFFVGAAISLLMLSAGFQAIGGSYVANELATIACYFLILTVLGLLIEHFRKS